MVELDTILSLLQTASIIIGVFYYIMRLQTSFRTQQLTFEAQQLATETRQAQLFMNLYNTYRDPEFRKMWNEIRFQWEWENFEDFWEKYGPETDHFATRASVFGFFEGIGILVRKNLLDKELVNDLISSSVLGVWEKYEAIIKEQRTFLNAYYVWDDFEYLYNTLKPLRKQREAKFRN